MSPSDLARRLVDRADSRQRRAYDRLTTSIGFRRLSPDLQSLLLAYLCAAGPRMRRLAWKLGSLLTEPGFVAADNDTKSRWIRLYALEVLSQE